MTFAFYFLIKQKASAIPFPTSFQVSKLLTSLEAKLICAQYFKSNKTIPTADLSFPNAGLSKQDERKYNEERK